MTSNGPRAFPPAMYRDCKILNTTSARFAYLTGSFSREPLVESMQGLVLRNLRLTPYNPCSRQKKFYPVQHIAR